MGINRIEKNAEHTVSLSITKQGGLPSNEINGMAFFKGCIYVATINGLCYFNPKSIKPSTFASPIYITRLLANELLLNDETEHTFSYTQNDIAIEYVGLAYRSLGKVLYRYKMLGIDTNWHYTQNTSVRFPKLKSGKYKFLVSARNNDGYWNENPAAVTFTIRSPYWKTIWFQVLLSLFLASIALAVYRYRIYTLNKRNAQKREEEFKRHKLQEDLIATRHQALVQQMNPYFVFNALNSIQSLLYEDNPTDARNYLTKFAKLMRQILENIDAQNVSIDREIDTLKLYLDLERLRFGNNFDYSIFIDPAIDSQRTLIPTMILQPYVENAINHGLKNKEGGSGFVKIAINHDAISGSVLCNIEDNGVGRKMSSEINAMLKNKPKSFGTSITEKRMALVNQLYGRQFNIHIDDLEGETGEPLGTRVRLTIPFVRS